MLHNSQSKALSNLLTIVIMFWDVSYLVIIKQLSVRCSRQAQSPNVCMKVSVTSRQRTDGDNNPPPVERITSHKIVTYFPNIDLYPKETYLGDFKLIPSEGALNECTSTL